MTFGNKDALYSITFRPANKKQSCYSKKTTTSKHIYGYGINKLTENQIM